MKRRLLVGFVLALTLCSATVGAQTFTAQIQQFWNLLRTGSLQFVTVNAVGLKASTISMGTGVPDATHPFNATFSTNTNEQFLWFNNNAGASTAAEACIKADTNVGCISAQGVNQASEPQRVTLYTNMGAGGTSGTPGWDIVSCFGSTPTLCNTRFFTNTTDGIVGERARITSIGLVMNTANTAVIQLASTNQAGLAAVLTVNGQSIYCTDCTIANPCAGAGTGAFAKRINGANVCN
jgi:hypothetical protein